MVCHGGLPNASVTNVEHNLHARLPGVQVRVKRFQIILSGVIFWPLCSQGLSSASGGWSYSRSEFVLSAASRFQSSTSVPSCFAISRSPARFWFRCFHLDPSLSSCFIGASGHVEGHIVFVHRLFLVRASLLAELFLYRRRHTVLSVTHDKVDMHHLCF